MTLLFGVTGNIPALLNGSKFRTAAMILFAIVLRQRMSAPRQVSVALTTATSLEHQRSRVSPFSFSKGLPLLRCSHARTFFLPKKSSLFTWNYLAMC
jgi:hypothetical protein